MKTIGRIKIEKARLLINEELLTIKGGYDQFLCLMTTSGGTSFWNFWQCEGCTPAQATQTCCEHYGISGATCDCGC